LAIEELDQGAYHLGLAGHSYTSMTEVCRARLPSDELLELPHLPLLLLGSMGKKTRMDGRGETPQGGKRRGWVDNGGKVVRLPMFGLVLVGAS
jgi:hypothetical protein